MTMNVDHFAFCMRRTQTVLQQTQVRDDHYFLRRRGRGLRNFQKKTFLHSKILLEKKSYKGSHGEKIEQVLSTDYSAPVSYFKRYSCMLKLSPTKENHPQHEGDNNILHPRNLPNIPLPLPLPHKKIIVCP